MPRRKTPDGEALESPEGSPAEIAARAIAEQGTGEEPTPGLPTMEPVAYGSAEKPIDPPVRIWIRDQHGGFRPGLLVGMEIHAGVAPTIQQDPSVPAEAAGRTYRAKRLGETLYQVLVNRDAAGNLLPKQEHVTGTFAAEQLALMESL